MLTSAIFVTRRENCCCRPFRNTSRRRRSTDYEDLHAQNGLTTRSHCLHRCSSPGSEIDPTTSPTDGRRPSADAGVEGTKNSTGVWSREVTHAGASQPPLGCIRHRSEEHTSELQSLRH